MKKIILLVLCLDLTGCAFNELFGSNYLEVRNGFKEENRQNLARLKVGMTKAEVLELMGAASIKSQGMLIENPYYSETLKGKDFPLDVVYYFAKEKAKETRDLLSFDKYEVKNSELIPVVFHADILIGWGDDFLSANLSVYEREMKRLGAPFRERDASAGF